jgi:UDPglucose--hexose-1-phosphate uridylyltransferase
MKVIKERKTCPYCTIFAKKKASSRLIFGNNEFIAFAPYYSMGSFEVWILPRRHVSFLGDCNDKLLFVLGDTLRASLRSIGES